MLFSASYFTIEVIALLIALLFSFNKRPSIKFILLIITLIAVPSILLYIHTYKWIGFGYLILSSIAVFFVQTKNARAIFDILLLAAACMISETLSQVLLFSLIANVFDVTYFSSKSTLMNWLDILFFLLFFSVSFYLYQLSIKRIWPSIAISIISQAIFIVIAFLTVALLTLNLFISLSLNLYSSALFNLFIQMIYFILLFAFSTILLLTIKKENKVKQSELEHKQLKQYMSELEKVNNNMNKFKHDYQNILLTMHSYIAENNMNGLKEYFYERIAKFEEKSLQDSYAFTQLNQIKQLELKGLLSSKALVAAESNIPIQIEVPEIIEMIEMDVIDLTRILGNLVDNAIEAVMKSEKQQINLAILKKLDGATLIVLENDLADDTILLHHLFNKGYSTKESGRGQGLVTVREIVHRYSNVTMNTRVENHRFIHEIEIRSMNTKKHAFQFFKRKLA